MDGPLEYAPSIRIIKLGFFFDSFLVLNTVTSTTVPLGDVLLLNTQLFTEMESTRIDTLAVEEEGVCNVNGGNGECQHGGGQHSEGSEKLEEPKVGMVFSSQDDVYRYYTNYGIQQGFRVNRRSTRCDDYGILRYFTFACSREKKRVSTSKNRYSNLTSGTNCQAKIRTIMQCDGSFKLSGVALEHNHPLTPGETRCFKYKKLDQDAKTRVRQQSRTSDIVQTGACETLMIGDKRSRNSNGQEEDSIFVIQVTEHVKVGDSEKDAKFIVNFSAVDCELNCTCHLFEFSGIICRHTLSVLTQSKVQQVPSKYILSRWRKDIKRKCSFVKDSYQDLDVNPSAQRYHEMCRYFHEVATMSADCKDQSITVMNALHELKAKIGMPV
ncbi:hypothetical protein MKW92_017404 [Papaver armeniacum]|nr:hypothetical protein MKW92_017404 [Papaver armeniacum]